jgi:hypothetical protein
VQEKLINALERFGSSAKANLFPPNLFKVFFFMAKDPAVLFYTSDFLTGVRRMTYEQVGKYITLLCMQHQYGSLTEKDMLHICGTYDEDIWCKFEKTDAGFLNKRMHEEAEKRKRYSESRRNNKIKGIESKHMTNICESYDKHMENENENVNEVINKNKIQKGRGFLKPELFEVQNYFEEVGNLNEAEGFFNYYESNGWKVGKNPMKDWKAASRNWIKNSKNYTKNVTTKSSSDIYAERRAELHQYAEKIDQLRGIRP